MPSLSRALPAGFIPPCLPSSAPQPPSGELWLHEIKHDGDRVRLYSRPGSIRPPRSATGRVPMRRNDTRHSMPRRSQRRTCGPSASWSRWACSASSSATRGATATPGASRRSGSPLPKPAAPILNLLELKLTSFQNVGGVARVARRQGYQGQLVPAVHPVVG
jgi:hypothetical protein